MRLLGPRTLLRQTLDRVSLAIPEERTLVVTVRRHAGYIAEENSVGRVARNPEATVAIFPSDHFLLGELSTGAIRAVGRFWGEAVGRARPRLPRRRHRWNTSVLVAKQRWCRPAGMRCPS